MMPEQLPEKKENTMTFAIIALIILFLLLIVMGMMKRGWIRL